jgi:hypothetical protein
VIEKAYVRALPDGFSEVFVPMTHLNPDGQPFEQVVFSPLSALPDGWVEIDKIGLTSAPDPKTLPPVAAKKIEMSVTCGGPKLPINPLIYGIGMGHDVPKDEHHWLMSATIRRWGGNPTSRYNWKLGNAWNTASDWYFENVDYVGTPGYSYATFIQHNKKRAMKTALTVPMIGWVAKDTSSVSFPRAKHAVQDGFDPGRPEAGNGRSGNKPITPPHPSTTSVPAPSCARIRRAAAAAFTSTSSTTNRRSGIPRIATCIRTLSLTTSSSKRRSPTVRPSAKPIRRPSSQVPPNGAGSASCTAPKTWMRVSSSRRRIVWLTATCR